MKKFGFICAAVLAALMSSCGNGTPTADMKSDLDSLSYAVGMAQFLQVLDRLAENTPK